VDIEKLMNRKVEIRVIAGFEPGNAVHQLPRSSNKQQPQRHQQRRPQQQQRRPQQQQRRPSQHAHPVNRPTGTPAPQQRPKQATEQRPAQLAYPRTVSRG
jgi:hypothetical protein